MIIEIHSKWEYESVDSYEYNQTAVIKGLTIYYGKVKNDLNNLITNAYLQIDDIKIHFEYTENDYFYLLDFIYFYCVKTIVHFFV